MSSQQPNVQTQVGCVGYVGQSSEDLHGRDQMTPVYGSRTEERWEDEEEERRKHSCPGHVFYTFKKINSLQEYCYCSFSFFLSCMNGTERGNWDNGRRVNKRVSRQRGACECGCGGAERTSSNQAENSRLPQTDLIIIEWEQLFYWLYTEKPPVSKHSYLGSSSKLAQLLTSQEVHTT